MIQEWTRTLSGHPEDVTTLNCIMCYVTCLYVPFNALYEEFELECTLGQHYRLCANGLVSPYRISFEPSFIVL